MAATDVRNRNLGGEPEKKEILRYPLDKIQETHDFLLISILDIDRGKNRSSDPREI